VLIVLLALGQEDAPNGEEFFKYVLNDSKIMTFEIQKLVIFPQSIPKADDTMLKPYFKNLRQNDSIITSYITEKLMSDIVTNSALLNKIM
jgi:hypothetical protein